MTKVERLRAEILKISAHHEYFVHRWNIIHSMRRKLTRRMTKDGLLVMVRHDREYFYYRTVMVTLPQEKT